MKMIPSGDVQTVNGNGVENEMSKMNKDTRKKSLSEAFVNSFGSIIITTPKFEVSQRLLRMIKAP